MGLRGAEAASEALAPLCAQLTRGLGTASATARPTLPAALQALSSIGRLLPDVFAPHAEAICTFVMQVYPPVCLLCQVLSSFMEWRPGYAACPALFLVVWSS